MHCGTLKHLTCSSPPHGQYTIKEYAYILSDKWQLLDSALNMVQASYWALLFTVCGLVPASVPILLQFDAGSLTLGLCMAVEFAAKAPISKDAADVN